MPSRKLLDKHTNKNEKVLFPLRVEDIKYNLA